MFQLLLVFVLFTGIAYYVLFRRSRKRLYELAATFPAPFDLPLIGSTYIGYGLNSTGIVEYLMPYLHTLKTPIRAWMGPFLGLVFDQPDHLAVILNSPNCVEKSVFQSFFRFEKGLLNVEHHLWRPLRKQLGPPLSGKVVGTFVPKFNTESDKLVQYLDQFVGKGAINLLPKVAAYSMAGALVNLFDVDIYVDDFSFMEEFADNTEK